MMQHEIHGLRDAHEHQAFVPHIPGAPQGIAPTFSVWSSACWRGCTLAASPPAPALDARFNEICWVCMPFAVCGPSTAWNQPGRPSAYHLEFNSFFLKCLFSPPACVLPQGEYRSGQNYRKLLPAPPRPRAFKLLLSASTPVAARASGRKVQTTASLLPSL